MTATLPWFRFYDEALDDPKVQQLPAPLFKHWVNFLSLANKGMPRGTVQEEYGAIAFRLRVSEAEARDVVATLMACGLIEATDGGKLVPHNWDTRQRRSDSSAERVAAHRARVRPCNVPVTLQDSGQKRYGNALEKSREEKEKSRERTEENDPLVVPPEPGVSKPARSRAKRRTALDPAFFPDEELVRWTMDQGWPDARMRVEVEKFHEHHGKLGNTMADWRLAWKTWVRKGLDIDSQRRVRAGPGEGPDPILQRWAEAAGRGPPPAADSGIEAEWRRR